MLEQLIVKNKIHYSLRGGIYGAQASAPRTIMDGEGFTWINCTAILRWDVSG